MYKIHISVFGFQVMKMYVSALFTIVIIFILSHDVVADTQSPYKHLVEANLDFCLQVYNELVKKNGYQNNVVFSPFSIYSVLLMTELGSRSYTSQEICQILHICNVNITHIHEAFGQIVNELLSDASVKESLAVANKLYIQKGLEISKFYQMALKYYYNSTVKEVDFQNDAHGAREIINNWVHEQTSGQILHFLPKLPPQTTQIMTVNALYFNSEWLWKFDPTMTEPKARFYVTPHFHASVPMMVAKLHLAHGHSPSLDASILELPFKSNRISLFLVLPDQLEGLNNLQKKLNSTTMKQLISTMKKKEVNVRVPKFSVESQPSLANVLRNLGVNRLFSPTLADLRGITPHNQIHMTDMMHRVIVQLEERGSIATAATAMIVERIGSFNGQFFEADHPFLFFIMDKQSGLVLFMGRIAGP